MLAGDIARSECKGRILVADDSRVVIAVIAGYLRKAGYEVRSVENGAQALALLDTDAFDAIITDLGMPELDGFGVLEAVRSRSLLTEVIVLTGANDMTSAIRALRLGAHDFLTKPPAGPDEVVLTVDRAVEKKRLRETNIRLMQELEALSRVDALTGVANRRVFDEALAAETSRAQRYGYPISLALLDIDHFKLVNDTHGHPAGDAVLKQFARLVSGELREHEVIHRYGGEEFAVLLPHTDLPGAMTAAGRWLKHLARTPFKIDAKSLIVTASAGVATLQGRDLVGSDLVARADAALYAAKRGGRNRAMGTALPIAPPPAAAKRQPAAKAS
jgi:diguanylate cyclase (GGDEF)-like protein